MAFTGFEDLANYSEESKDIKKLPRIMVSVILIVTIVFILLYLALLGNISSNDPLLFTDPFDYLARPIFSIYSKYVITAIGVAVTISSLISSLRTSARNVLSMSEKGFLPQQLYKVSANKIPRHAIIVACLLILSVILIGKLDIVIFLTNFLYFFMVFILALSVVKLREKRKSLERPYKIPLFPIVPLLLAYFLLMLVFFLDLHSLAYGIVWVFFGFILYMLRIVGEARLKTALIGGATMLIFLLFFLVLLLKEVRQELFQSIFPAIIFAFALLFILGILLFGDVRKGFDRNHTRRS